MTARLHGPGVLVAGLLLVLVGGLAWRIPGVVHWHDSQRLLQCVLLLAAGTATALSAGLRSTLSTEGLRWGGWVVTGVLFALAVGTVSAAASGFARIALLEVAVFTLLALVMVPAAMAAREANARRFDRAMLAGLLLCCAVAFVPFLIAWLAAVSSGVGYQRDLLWRQGFSNPRFLGQFHTLVLPLLACLCVQRDTRRSLRAATFAVLAGTWLLALFTATRATWYALVPAFVLVSLIAPRLVLRLTVPAVAALGLAIPLAWVMFDLIPASLLPAAAGLPEMAATEGGGVGATAARLADPLDLRLRDQLWLRALDVVRETPLLGAGPMGLALDPSPVASHPHTALVQLAAEWGLPAVLGFSLAACAMALRLAAGFRRRVLHAFAMPADSLADRERLLATALLVALVAAAVHAQVDGLLVMPVSQLLCALMAGWAGSLLLPMAAAAPTQRTRPDWIGKLAAVVPAVCVLALLAGAAPESLRLQQRAEQREQACAPLAASTRFWAEGSFWGEQGPPVRFMPLPPPPDCRPIDPAAVRPR